LHRSFVLNTNTI